MGKIKISSIVLTRVLNQSLYISKKEVEVLFCFFEREIRREERRGRERFVVPLIYAFIG